jgi:diguanylate cyclase (GGDEF)-like protein
MSKEMLTGETDALTGLANRGAFDRELELRVGEALKNNEPLGFVMVDVDHFKKVNDTHGHQAGDDVLRGVAECLQLIVRRKGQAYRYGGEELVLLLPNHVVEEAVAVAERARRALEAAAIASIKVTASFGVACLPDHAQDGESLFKRADEAVYDAKNRGRNLVRVSGEPAPASAGPRPTERRAPEPGRLTDQQRQQMREQFLVRGQMPRCPEDGAILQVRDISTMASIGKDFMIHCPMCGLTENIVGPQR